MLFRSGDDVNALLSLVMRVEVGKDKIVVWTLLDADPNGHFDFSEDGINIDLQPIDRGDENSGCPLTGTTSEGANTVPFPPCGENCTMLAPSSFPKRTRFAGLRFGYRFFDNSTKFQKMEVSDLDRIKELGRYQKILLLLMAVMILAFTVTYPIVTARSGFLDKDAILVPA